MNDICKNCGCSSTIKAHIIPQALIRAFRQRGPDKHTVAVSHGRATIAQNANGIYDPSILCSACDGKIGVADKWFVESLDFFHSCIGESAAYTPTALNIDAGMALRFAVSVVYRAALSQREHFQCISLGPYIDIAGKIALGAAVGDDDVPLVLVNILTSDSLDTRQFVFYPVRCSLGNGPYFVFTLSGVQFLVKFGGRYSGVSCDDHDLWQLRLRVGQSAVVIPYPFDESAEYDYMRWERPSHGVKSKALHST